MEMNKNNEKDFHAVEFMRQVHTELTGQYYKDKISYLEFVMKAF